MVTIACIDYVAVYATQAYMPLASKWFRSQIQSVWISIFVLVMDPATKDTAFGYDGIPREPFLHYWGIVC